MHVRAIALLAASLVLSAVGCSAGEGDDAASADADLSKYNLTDAQLAAALATPTTHLTAAAMRKAVAQTVSPRATTARLHILNDYIAKGIAQVDPNDPNTPYDMFALTMEGVFWQTPRDLTSAPAGFGGQSFATSVDVSDELVSGETHLKVNGVAHASYKLTFTMAGTPVTVDIRAGSTSTQTAAAIASAIRSNNDALMQTIGDEQPFDVIGGQHGGILSGVDDLEVSRSADTVTILVAMNG